MPTGDSLAIFTLLASAALACMIGALTAPSGWRVTLLWAMCAAFAVASLGWLFPPTQSPFFMGMISLFGAFARSGALVMLGTVGIVALVTGGRQPVPAKGLDLADIPAPLPRPDFAPTKPVPTKWVPDTPLIDAMIYLFQESRWSEQGRREFIDVKVKFLLALQESQLLAWGKTHPDDDEAFQIRSDFWIEVEITPQSNTVFSKTRNVNAYDVKLSLPQIELAWPRKPVEPA